MFLRSYHFLHQSHGVWFSLIISTLTISNDKIWLETKLKGSNISHVSEWNYTAIFLASIISLCQKINYLWFLLLKNSLFSDYTAGRILEIILTSISLDWFVEEICSNFPFM